MRPGQFREREIFPETGLPVRDCEPWARVRRVGAGELHDLRLLRRSLAVPAGPAGRVQARSPRLMATGFVFVSL
jgi:hypothetical protein